MQDDPLIQGAQEGDESAFENLLDQHYELIYRFAYKWSGSVADAEDITQLACIKLARSIKQYRFEAAFTSWLYRLVINCAKDWLKSETRHHSCDDLGQIDEPVQNNTQENATYLRQVLVAINAMAEGYKETALLVFAEGFSHKETADILGEKEKTISWRIHEIRKQLQVLTQQEQAR